MSEWTADDEYLSLRKAVLRHGDPSAILASLERLLELRAAPVAGEGLPSDVRALLRYVRALAEDCRTSGEASAAKIVDGLGDFIEASQYAANQPVAEERT